MSSVTCPDCMQGFSRRDVMLRHYRHKHMEDTQRITHGYPQSTEAYPPPPPPPPPQGTGAYPPPPPPLQPPPQGIGAYPPPPPQGTEVYPPPQGIGAHGGEKAMILYHPMTMLISGPTACGKTTFVKELLQHLDTRVQPSIQRIVWLYKRWQPLYTVIQRTVSPPVQFIQGIPGDLDDDDFFDPTVNNLLVIDDLFSEACKDKRIAGLFTEGSHHRSLSVICINQNLFGAKDPTLKRNTQYLILFKTAIDSQAIMTLARQMYPGRSGVFMNIFAKATKAPYGYILVDLKPFTPETERLKSKVVWQDDTGTILTNQKPDRPPRPIKEGTQGTFDHSPDRVQTVNIAPEETTMSEKMNACDDCGLLFDMGHDVQRHVKRGWCTESQDPQIKKRKLEDETTESESMDAVEDNEAFLHMWTLAKQDGSERYKELYDKYEGQEEDEEDASDMAEERVKPYEEKSFLSRYSTLLETYWLPLQDNPFHARVLRQIQTLTQKGVPVTSAVTRVLRKHRQTFEDLFDTEVSEDEQDSDGESSDTDEEEDI